MAELPPPLDVVAVGAHPDDVEIACGGTLALLVRQGYQVGIIDLTDGEPTPHSPGPHVRLEEAKQAAAELGVSVRVQLELPNRRLFDTFDGRVALAKEFRRYRPKIVIGFGNRTPLASPDHWQATLLTEAAVFYSRLTKWPEHFGDLPTHSITSLLYYSLDWGSLAVPSGAGHVVVDISTTLEQKLASIRRYVTQFPPSKAHVFERVKAFAMQQGQSAGYEAGELFATARMVGTRDLMSFLLSQPPELPRGPVT